MNSQEYKVRPTIVSIYNNEPLFFPSSIFVNKCNNSCSNINDPMLMSTGLMSILICIMRS